MQAVWIILIAITVAGVVNVITQMLTVRFVSIMASIIYGLLFGGIFYCLINWSLSDNQNLEIVYVGFLIYLTFSFCFWAFLNLNLTSLRIRILKELYLHPQGLSRLSLTERYSPEELLLRRIQRLKANGQIVTKQDKLQLQSKQLLVIYLIIQGLRILILPKRVREG